jgi:CheY-like chemotaxis protein
VMHEIGVKFDHVVNPRNFLTARSLADCFLLEAVEPDRLEGRVLGLSPDAERLDQFQALLTGTRVRFTGATSEDEALAAAREGFGVTLCDLAMLERDGEDLLARLREGGLTAPAVLVGPSGSAVTRETLIRLGADAYLTAPSSPAPLHRAVGEFLLFGDKLGPLRAADPNTASAVTAERLASQLPRYAACLRNSLQARDVRTSRSLCEQLARQSCELDLPQLAGAASAASDALAGGEWAADSVGSIRALIDLCERGLAGSAA